MSHIIIEKNPSDKRLKELGVYDWDVWSKEVSVFPWTYYIEETCYVLEGEAKVTPTDGDSVTFGAGDLVTFQPDLACTWEILKPIRKHYRFS